MLRSFHLTRSRMTSDTGEEFWVRWYPAAAGALHYPSWHAFGSPVWEDDLTDEFIGPGMFHLPLLWRGSTYNAPPGQEHHGLAEWFQFGLPASLLGTGVIDDLCGRPAIDPRGGIGLNGDAVMMGITVPVDFQLDKIDTPLSAGTLNNVDLGHGGAFRLNPGGTLAITGFLAAVNGRMVIIENVGTDPVGLLHQNAGSDAANRIITIDEFACRIDPTYATWLQYDGTSQRWRELSTVPIVREKGDLLTRTTLRATRLPAPATAGKILTTDPATDTGLRWADGPAGNKGGPDLNYYRQFGVTRFGGRHWYTGTYADQRNAGPAVYPNDKIWAQAFISPQSGTIERVYGYITTVGTATNAIQVGIYSNTADWDLYPKDLLAFTEQWDGDILGAKDTAIEVELQKDQLYWIVGISANNASGSTASCYTTPAFGGWPLYGQQEGTSFGGKPVNNIIMGDWSFADGLPLVFPGGGIVDLTPVVPHVGLAYRAHS